MLIIKINMNRVKAVIYSILAVIITGLIGAMMIPVTYYMSGRLVCALFTIFLLGAVVSLVLGLIYEFWNK